MVSPVAQFLTENQKLLENAASQLYDAAWPQWRNHRVLQISLQILGAEEMARFNAKFRNVDSPTDVLTFPLFEENGIFSPPSGMIPLPLGDILLCPEIICANAKEHKVPEESEAALVVFHGLLHLLAWDHDTPEHQKRMWEVQERFRDLFLQMQKDKIRNSEEKN